MPINKKSKINNVITFLHLWLGLVSGIIVFVVSITGCIFCFQNEISQIWKKDILFVRSNTSKEHILPISVLQKKAQSILGNQKEIAFITTYSDPDRAWEFLAYKPGDPNAITYKGSVSYYESVFLNPYTGALTGHINYLNNFFVIIKYLHWSLLLSDKYGQPIVGWSTVIFVILLITGLIMWIPKRWNHHARERSFKIKWRTKWKRINYDMHNVLGFYAFSIALILGLTGMVFAFRWFQSTVYVAANLSTAIPHNKVYQSDSAGFKNNKLVAIDEAYQVTRNLFPNAKRFGVSALHTNTDPIDITVYHKKNVYYDITDVYFDQKTGKYLGQNDFGGKSRGEKLILMNYDIHVGAIGGLPGEIIAFIISLICASLPITGSIIWYNRRKKKLKRKRLQFAAKNTRLKN